VVQEHTEHFKASIENYYQISCDLTDSAYYGLELDWDYKNRYVDLSMLGYIKEALHTFQYTPPTCPENAPHTWSPPVYGAKTQYIEEHHVTCIQLLAGTLLYYAGAVDPTLTLPVNILAS
jgi:hypothetical protein